MHLQAGDAALEFRELVLLAEVLDNGHPVQEVDRLLEGGIEALSHCEDRGETGAACHQDRRTNERTQMEAAFAAPQRNAVTRFRPIPQIVRHHAVG